MLTDRNADCSSQTHRARSRAGVRAFGSRRGNPKGTAQRLSRAIARPQCRHREIHALAPRSADDGHHTRDGIAQRHAFADLTAKRPNHRVERRSETQNETAPSLLQPEPRVGLHRSANQSDFSNHPFADAHVDRARSHWNEAIVSIPRHSGSSRLPYPRQTRHNTTAIAKPASHNARRPQRPVRACSSAS